MNKIRYHNDDYQRLELDYGVFQSNVFYFPEHLDKTFEAWLLEHQDKDTQSFRIKHYRILTELLINSNHYTHSINHYKIHLEIQKENFFRTGYEVGKKKSTYYLINNHFEYNVCIDTGIEIDKIQKINTARIIEKLKNNKTYMYTIENIEIAARECVEYCYKKYKIEDEYNMPGKMARIYASFNVFANEFRADTGKKVDRIFSTYTQLPEDIRKFFLVNGKHFHEFDIICAQPTLLAISLQRNGYPIDDCYRNNVHNLYDDIMKYAADNNIEYEDIKCTTDKGKYEVQRFHFIPADNSKEAYTNARNETKTLCYRSIFFSCKSPASSKTAMIFQKLYPITYNSLKLFQEALKKQDKTVAQVAQNLEPAIMYDDIDFINEFFHVHDALYITDETEGWAYCNAITEKYKEYVDIKWKHTENIIEKLEKNDTIKPLEFSVIDVPSRKSSKGLRHIIKHRSKSAKTETLMNRYIDLRRQNKSLKEIATELGKSESYLYKLGKKVV